MAKRKKSFTGYIDKGWKVKKYTHSYFAGFHECIGIDSNICTKHGLGYVSTDDRVKVKVTIEEIENG